MTLSAPSSRLRGITLAWVALSVGCLSRWSGCRTYDTGHLEGPGWTARVQCAPRTEVSLRGAGPVLRGCDAQWTFVVARDGNTARAGLEGSHFSARDCGAVRDFCKAARGALAQRATAAGTWVAARPPTGATRLAFVSSTCNAVQMLPPDTAPASAPDDAVARQPDGPAWLDAVVARGSITDGSWPLVCGLALTQRLAAVRAAALACRTPDAVADALFRADPASVDAVWNALATGQLPCGHRLRARLLDAAPDAVGDLAVHSLALCDARCPDRDRVDALYALGRLRLAGGRDVAQRIAAAGPPPPLAAHATPDVAARYADAYRAWVYAQWALSRIDARAGAETALATLRRLPVPEGSITLPGVIHDDPERGAGDPASDLCGILAGNDTAETRALLWQLAGDETVSVGARQRALLTLARLGDARASGETLAHNPLTADQAAVVASARDGARTGRPASNGTGGGHHRHHWH
jgi:hypothetical protein